MQIRDLTEEEIDVRVGTISQKGASLLLYKNARVDMDILDQAVGQMNWKREHSRDNANCIVSIWDEQKQQWVSKEDTGTESYTEKEKGLASDSFKRACVNWGIGRELYTAPFIWVNSSDMNISEKGGKYTTNDKFEVSNIKIVNKKIVALSIVKTTRGQYTPVFNYTLEQTAPPPGANDVIGERELKQLKGLFSIYGKENRETAIKIMCSKYAINDIAELNKPQFVKFRNELIEEVNKIKDKRIQAMIQEFSERSNTEYNEAKQIIETAIGKTVESVVITEFPQIVKNIMQMIEDLNNE